MLNRKYTLAAKINQFDQIKGIEYWKNERLIGHSIPVVLVHSYLKSLYIDLDGKKFVPILNGHPMVRKNETKFAGSRLLSIIGKKSFKKGDGVSLIENTFKDNHVLVKQSLKDLGVNPKVINENTNFLIFCIYSISEYLIKFFPELTKAFLKAPEDVKHDVTAYLMLGPKAKLKTKVVVPIFRKFHVDSKEDIEVRGVKLNVGSSKTMGLKDLDLVALKANKLDKTLVKDVIIKFMNKYLLDKRKAFLETKDYENRLNESKKKYGQSRVYDERIKSNLDSTLKAEFYLYPILHFSEFSSDVGGDKDLAIFCALMFDKTMSWFVTSARSIKKIPSLRINADDYAKSYGIKSNPFEQAIERALQYKKQIDFKLFSPKSWMIPYLSTTDITRIKSIYKAIDKDSSEVVEQSDPVTAITSMSGSSLQAYLKKLVLTEDQFVRLDDVLVIKLLKTLDIDDLFKYTFSGLKDSLIVKQTVLSALLATKFRLTYDSPFGEVKEKHLKMALPDEEIPRISLSIVKKWNVRKRNEDEIFEKYFTIKREEQVKVEQAVEDTHEVEQKLEAFMANVHGVSFKVKKLWTIKRSEKIENYLRNNLKNPEVKVIKDGFHGTAVSAAGAILLSGFKLRGTKKTGRSMGDVLYIAPNIDKSLQYVGESFGRKADIGIIFHGDILISGKALSKVSGETDTDEDCSWTFTKQFQTQEIGLTNPNIQYVLHHAYLVERINGSHGPAVEERTKFKAKQDLSKYVKELGL
jgi:hypothetical protein